MATFCSAYADFAICIHETLILFLLYALVNSPIRLTKIDLPTCS